MKTPSTAIETFNFHGDTLDVVHLPDGDVGVSLRRLCEVVPVDPDAQAKRLAREAGKGARWACTFKMAVHDESGRNQEMLVLPRRSIPMFAATISLGHVREDLRPGIAAKLALLQDECAEVLADHFLGRRGTAPVLGAEQIAQLVATASARAAELAVAPLLARIASLEAQGGRPCIGTGGARLHVLDPLKEIARIEARAVGRPEDDKTLRAMRMAAEETLRDRLGFPRKGGQSWVFFPTARLGDLHCSLARLLHDARKRAAVAAPVRVQLSLAVDNTVNRAA